MRNSERIEFRICEDFNYFLLVIQEIELLNRLDKEIKVEFFFLLIKNYLENITLNRNFK